MLIADFTTAKHQLTEAVKSVRRGLRSPEILMHPMEQIEGGLPKWNTKFLLNLDLVLVHRVLACTRKIRCLARPSERQYMPTSTDAPHVNARTPLALRFSQIEANTKIDSNGDNYAIRRGRSKIRS